MSVLDEAARAVHGARGKDYGAPHVNHGCTAELMQSYLARKYGSAKFDARVLRPNIVGTLWPRPAYRIKPS